MRTMYIFQLVSALKKVHSQGGLHCNLKPSSLLLSKGGLLLADFGQVASAAGSMFWVDSDARDGKYNMESEVYSFGLCMHYLIWGQPLFNKFNK
jgi:serine/threonine protein kinase